MRFRGDVVVIGRDMHVDVDVVKGGDLSRPNSTLF